MLSFELRKQWSEFNNTILIPTKKMYDSLPHGVEFTNRIHPAQRRKTHVGGAKDVVLMLRDLFNEKNYHLFQLISGSAPDKLSLYTKMEKSGDGQKKQLVVKM